jgi:hypothetical protein
MPSRQVRLLIGGEARDGVGGMATKTVAHTYGD